MDTIKLRAEADAIRQGAYHRFMAMLSAHPKTTVLIALAVGLVVGHLV